MYNSYSTAAITVGQSVQWDFTTDGDGVGVTRPTARATGAGFTFAGVVAEASITAGDYGLIQVYGYHASTRMRVKTGSITPAPGRPLTLASAGSVFCLECFSTASNVILKYPSAFVLGTAFTTWTTATRRAFIKAL